MVLAKPDHIIICESICFPVISELLSVKTANSFIRGKPHKTCIILQHIIDGIAGQSISRSIVFHVWILRLQEMRKTQQQDEKETSKHVLNVRKEIRKCSSPFMYRDFQVAKSPSPQPSLTTFSNTNKWLPINFHRHCR